MTSDARFISALKLIRPTRDVLTVGHHFVIASGTILLAIAYPTAMNASNSILTKILSLNTCQWRFAVGVIYRCAILK